jgi:hypothetical protein
MCSYQDSFWQLELPDKVEQLRFGATNSQIGFAEFADQMGASAFHQLQRFGIGRN